MWVPNCINTIKKKCIEWINNGPATGGCQYLKKLSWKTLGNNWSCLKALSILHLGKTTESLMVVGDVAMPKSFGWKHPVTGWQQMRVYVCLSTCVEPIINESKSANIGDSLKSCNMGQSLHIWTMLYNPAIHYNINLCRKVGPWLELPISRQSPQLDCRRSVPHYNNFKWVCYEI